MCEEGDDELLGFRDELSNDAAGFTRAYTSTVDQGIPHAAAACVR